MGVVLGELTECHPTTYWEHLTGARKTHWTEVRAAANAMSNVLKDSKHPEASAASLALTPKRRGQQWAWLLSVLNWLPEQTGLQLHWSLSSLVCCANSRGPRITLSPSKALARVHCPVSSLSPLGLDKPIRVPGAWTDLSCYCPLPETGQRMLKDLWGLRGGLTPVAHAALSDFPTVAFPFVWPPLTQTSPFFYHGKQPLFPTFSHFSWEGETHDSFALFFFSCIVFSGSVEAREPKQTFTV